VTDSFGIEFQSIRSMAGTPVKMMVIDGLLAVFVRDNMLLYDYSDPAVPELVKVFMLPLPVLDAVRRDNRLYTVGPEGVAIFDLVVATPEVVEYGGREGNLIDVDGDVLATSDGGSIHIYHLSDEVQPTSEPETMLPDLILSQNYPNPFNASTSIEYSVQRESRVEIMIYNILGQQVQVLVDQDKPVGNYEACWNGTDDRGRPVASGVYIYRVRVNDRVSSRKMILSK